MSVDPQMRSGVCKLGFYGAMSSTTAHYKPFQAWLQAAFMS